MYMAVFYTLVSPGKTLRLHFFTVNTVPPCVHLIWLSSGLGEGGTWHLVYGRKFPRGGGDLASPSSQSWKSGKGARTQRFSFSWTLAATRLPCEARAPWEAVVFILTVLFLASATFFPSCGLVQRHGLWHSKTNQHAYLLLFSPPWPSLLSRPILYLQPWLILEHSQQSLRHWESPTT